MQIMIVDDEKLALGHLMHVVEQAQPACQMCGFRSPSEALRYAAANPVDLAFLDVEMFGISGIELAKRLKDLRPRLNVVFVTGYASYAVEAFSVRASGYLLKPASVESVRAEIENLRIAIQPREAQVLRAQTFGNFEVFVNHAPLVFARSKCKELLAYLIDRRGAGSTAAELIAVLWEDTPQNLSLQKQFQTIVSDMLRTLKQADADSAIIKKRNFLAVDPEKIDCDYYRFLDGDVQAVNSYAGEYMTNYSWAEFTTGFLCRARQQ